MVTAGIRPEERLSKERHFRIIGLQLKIESELGLESGTPARRGSCFPGI